MPTQADVGYCALAASGGWGMSAIPPLSVVKQTFGELLENDAHDPSGHGASACDAVWCPGKPVCLSAVCGAGAHLPTL
jgi:hypothetical protein